ncbi:hypothetical protein XspCFBP7912_09460 [Xanthomonas sp. CFBP 7912]|nr:hypothetical protein XspCFBP7912_09460 [Xanthomonas sp. CFBP 7912]RJS02462.1 hypothetical protein XnspCFBP7698_16075 [Xanthomonas sp. CFBP 7698]
MASNFAYNLLMALVPGSAVSFYEGLLMAKQSKFYALKYESLQIVRAINYIGGGTRTKILRSDRADDLWLIASEL